MPVKLLLIVFLSLSCSRLEGPRKPHAPKEFSRGEIVLAYQLLTRIFDNEMAPLACVPDADEASLLLRTLQPRMELVQDDMEAVLDDPEQVTYLIQECDKSCTCGHVDELLREHLVVLSKKQKAMLDQKITPKEISRCLSFAQSTFCKSELYTELNKEKADFSFEEAPL